MLKFKLDMKDYVFFKIRNINEEYIDNSKNIIDNKSHSVDDNSDIDIDLCFNNGRCFF